MIEVTAAILKNNGSLLIAQRKSTGRLPNKWEFPGGKVEPGETPENCLKREMQEEFNIDVSVGKYLGESIYHYDHGSIKLLAYRTTWVTGEFTIKEHRAAKWININEISEFDFAPADKTFVERLVSGEIIL
jgi:8-oxo-dGTP diphosphatase